MGESGSKISTLSLAILGLIAQRPGSGYDIRKVFATTPMGSFSSSPGAIYPALKRLEKNGWVRGEIQNEGMLRPKQVFSLTDEGKRALRERLLLPVTRDDIIWNLDGLILRFAFMELVVGREATLQFLHQYQREAESYVESLERTREEMKAQMNTSANLALEHGIESYRMNADWAKRGIKAFEALKG